MKQTKKLTQKSHLTFLAVCLLAIGTLLCSSPVHAKKITSLRQAAKAAQKAVKHADVTELDKDYENGQLIYEVQLMKNTREYEITYRASDGKMLSYGWEKLNFKRYSNKKILSRKKCRTLALNEVPGAKISSLVQKYDNRIPVYKIKLISGKDQKKYTLKYHARTGKLLEYEWELKASTPKPTNNNRYIGLAKAKKSALSKVPGATIVKAEFDRDDGIPVYEIKLIKGAMEYEITFHAKSGKILEFDKEYNDSWW